MVGAVWICCWRSTMLILVVALWWSMLCGFVVVGEVPCQYLWWRYSGRCSVGMFFWVLYQFNNSGGAVAVRSEWVCCCGCNNSLIPVVAL